MSTGPIEVAEEALQKLDELEIVDQESKDKTEKSPRRVRLTDEERRKIWEEKQAQKPVLEQGIKGKVKWYSVRGKYGFIAREDGKNDVFVHQSAIAKSGIVRYFLRTLADEEEVEFDVVDGDKGPEAANVTGPEGAEVQGSRYYHILIRRRTSRRQSRPDGEKKTSSSKTEEEIEKNEEKDGKNEDKDGHNEEKKRKPKRQNRRRNRNADKKAEGDDKKAEGDANNDDDVEEKPARRRVSSDEKEAPKKGKTLQTKIESPKESGDASLGAFPAKSAEIH
ncbi:hypothetical protein PENTCL1PPCAC_22706 [Pristionchus entomophagus]|uniref:CSD domain-containing protein n=1 Tax=Pristionchus entomophagus TaxID=358040 RepID=A0AAV5U167_9BILA|nr:hypothetical protein PENTCL1PPCAC_22706 [Pristionchus entomophagus]